MFDSAGQFKGPDPPSLGSLTVRPRGAAGGPEMEWFQSSFSIFSALGGQNAPRIAGKTHMVWAHLTQRGGPRAHFFILTPPLIITFLRVLHKTPLKSSTSDFAAPRGYFPAMLEPRSRRLRRKERVAFNLNTSVDSGVQITVI